MKEMVSNNGNPTKKFYEKKFNVNKIKKYYSFFDKTRNGFLGLTEKVNDAMALRDLDSVVNENGNLVNKYPDDFSMWYIGYLNEETGDFKSEPRKVGEAKEYVKTEN